MSLREFWVGSQDAPRRSLVVGFGAVVLGTLVAWVVTNLFEPDNVLRQLVQHTLVPLVFFYLPALPAGLAGYLRAGFVTGIAIGAIPAALFVSTAVFGTIVPLPGVGGGDAPLWTITMAFAAISLVTATVGFFLGTSARLLIAWVRQH